MAQTANTACQVKSWLIQESLFRGQIAIKVWKRAQPWPPPRTGACYWLQAWLPLFRGVTLRAKRDPSASRGYRKISMRWTTPAWGHGWARFHTLTSRLEAEGWWSVFRGSALGGHA